MNLNVEVLNPLVALIAGILILLMPLARHDLQVELAGHRFCTQV